MFKFKDVRYKDIVNIENLEIQKGEVTTLVGESGGGKTTILRMLNKLISPTSGEITYKGEDLKKIDSIKHRQSVVMLSQSPVIFKGTIEENLCKGFIYQEKALPKKSEMKKVLNIVKLNKNLEDDSNRLSGGERQRLALARILLLNSDVYLLDEPTSALDEKLADELMDIIIKEAASFNKTIVMITHSNKIAMKYSNKVIEIENGNVKEGKYEWCN